jgi:hypothetical protein
MHPGRLSKLPFVISLLGLSLGACAPAQKLQPVTISSAGSTSYALGYPEALRSAADSFVTHRREAHELSSTLVSKAPKPKPNEDRALLVQAVDQADADGRRERSVQARRDERSVQTFWDSERGAIGARVGSAAQKKVEEGNCKDVQTQPAVQQALREGVMRQLEKRRLRASEAHRYLDLIKGKLSEPTWHDLEHTADDVTLASYIVYVALVDDVLEVQRLRTEHDAVAATLHNAVEREKAAPAARTKAQETQRQERVRLLSERLTAMQDASLAADKAVTDYESQLKQARTEYEQALAALRASFAPVAQAAASAQPAIATKH